MLHPEGAWRALAAISLHGNWILRARAVATAAALEDDLDVRVVLVVIDESLEGVFSEFGWHNAVDHCRPSCGALMLLRWYDEVLERGRAASEPILCSSRPL